MLYRSLLLIFILSVTAISQVPPIEPGVSHELAKWRAAHYSDVRYKLNLTLEKMSPVLKGTMEIRVKVGARTLLSASPQSGEIPPIILDWRKIKGHEEKSTIANVTINGKRADLSRLSPRGDKSVPAPTDDHLVFRDGVVVGENLIKLDFTSPILTSGSAITRYVDKEDGSEYIYSLFVPSDASTAFPVFDQPDLKARFELTMSAPLSWKVISNAEYPKTIGNGLRPLRKAEVIFPKDETGDLQAKTEFDETKPISTYVFAFAAGPWEKVSSVGETGGNLSCSEGAPPRTSVSRGTLPTGRVSASAAETSTSIYVRKSQAAKFKPHAAEVFRLNREAVKYFEQYFDYKFPFPKYDLVLIPEFPFGGMEHAGATFLRESSIIFPQEPTKNDLVSRATLIFHEAAHQWFGDTVTMRWFDDLWLKEGFATFTAYKAMEKIMPEMNAWKVFYERIKQGAYQTDSTRGTTAIYQPIANLSAAKSAYGNIVYNKAPAFLRQAEFYLGEDKFQTAVRAFLKKHEFGNAGWEDLVAEFEAASGQYLKEWASLWVKTPGVPKILVRSEVNSTQIGLYYTSFEMRQPFHPNVNKPWRQKIKILMFPPNGKTKVVQEVRFGDHFDTGGDSRGYFGKTFLSVQPLDYHPQIGRISRPAKDFVPSYSGTQVLTSRKFPSFIFPNYGDYGYGIFLLDEKSRDYVLNNIQNEKDPFLRTMMWGALWDSVREGELDPRVFVELVVKVLGASSRAVTTPSAQSGGHPSLDKEGSRTEEDESTVATLLGRTATALNYYIDDAERVGSPHVSKGSTLNKGRVEPSLTVGLRTRVEELLIERMRTSSSLGQRITYYRAFLNVAASEKARGVLKGLLAGVGSPHVSKGSTSSTDRVAPSLTVGLLTLRTKDKFDIVTRLLILGDPDAPKLLADLEKAEKSDDAKRYAYAAKAGIGTVETKAKYWNDFVSNKEISESWIEAAFGPWNSIRHSELTLPYLQRALQELPNHKRNRKIFFVNGWLGAFIGGQRSEEALNIVNKFLADNPNLDNDLRLKILENVDLIERAVRIRKKF